MRYSLQGVRTKSSSRALVKAPQLERAPTEIVPPGLSTGAARDSLGMRLEKASNLEECRLSPAEARAEAARIIEEARRQATELLAEAESRARELRQWSQETAEALCRESRDRGYRLGMAEAEKEITKKVDGLLSLSEGAIRAREELLCRGEPEVIELAIGIAEKIVGQELTVNPEIVASMVHRALDRAGKSDTYYLHVNPADAQVVKEYLRQDLTEVTCEIVADSHIERGGCVIATSHGHVDAQVSSQFAEVRTALLGEGDLRDE